MASDRIHALNAAIFEDWLEQFAAAWASLDADRAGPLFTADAVYHWTPFDAPIKGRAAIVSAWGEAFANQAEPRMASTVLTFAPPLGIARWATTFRRPATGEEVSLDGVLVAEFGNSGQCRLFREWWHTSDPEYAGGAARSG